MGRPGTPNKVNTMIILVPKSDFAETFSSAMVTAWGLGLSLTVLDSYGNTWLLGAVLLASLVVFPLLAGWLSSRLRNVALFPVCVLVAFSAAAAINESLYYGNDSSSYGYEPVGLTIFHAAIYGGGTYLIFCAGWVARHYAGRLLGLEATASEMVIAALGIACYSVGLSICLYIWVFDDHWSPLRGWDPLNTTPLILGLMAVLAGAVIMWSDGHRGRWRLTGLGISLLFLGGSVTLTFLPIIAILYGVGAVALVAIATWNVQRWRRQEAGQEECGN